MAVYDAAHELARALRESDEYQRYLKAKEQIKEKVESYRMLQNFRKHQLEAQTAQLGGQPVPEDTKEKLEQLYHLLQFQPLVQDFLEAEARVIKMVADVQRILSQSVDLELGLESVQAEDGDAASAAADGESPLWIP